MLIDGVLAFYGGKGGFIQVFVYSSALKHFTEVGPGTLLITFHTVVRWVDYPSSDADR